jgi:hypothetical protein
MTVARQQAHAVAIAVNNEAEAVIFDFVNPIRTGRHLGAAGRDRGLKLHDWEDMRLEWECESSLTDRRDRAQDGTVRHGEAISGAAAPTPTRNNAPGAATARQKPWFQL